MPRYIVKLQDYYLEWSTVVDAPVTYGMTLEEFKEYYQQEYGADGMRNLLDRLLRVEAKGTSSQLDDSVESVVSCNRAGKDETSLTVEQIIDFYCVRQGEGDRPVGTDDRFEDDED